METIELQRKTFALPGKVESYWFENSNIGLENTLFHRVTIPLKKFDSGLSYEDQPLETDIVFDWYKLNIENPEELNDINMSHTNYKEAEASIYVGSAHNWCVVKKLLFTMHKDNKYKVVGELTVEFENERVAKNEEFNFETTVEYIKA